MSEQFEYVLGIDLGPGSVGWAIIEYDGEEPVAIRAAGVRRFESGVLGDIEKGKDESRATQRRLARGPRRQNWRRQWRLRKLFRLLAESGLLPEASDDSPKTRHATLQTLDSDLRKKLDHNSDRVAEHVFPYWLRTQALDQPLSPHALGRALYHLTQRRGFLSNRKAAGDDEEQGKVKQGISDLAEAMRNADARTLGEYFSGLDPEESRIRGRWTSRAMYRDEFEKIWNAQQTHHPQLLTNELKEKITAAIFDQRPLKSQSHLIGRCDLEPDRRRAPLACLLAQQFRLLQRTNDLLVIAPDGEVRPLYEEERTKLLGTLATQGEMTWGKVRTLLGFKKSKEYARNYTFNFEEGGDKKLIGNRTAAKMASRLGEVWMALEPEKQSELVDEILAFESEEALARRLQSGWDLSPDSAQAVAGLRFEPDYASHSRKAMRKLLPKMGQGIQYATAKKEVYGDQERDSEQVENLPPLRRIDRFKEINNPAVERAASEMRKVVNAILRMCGGKKPMRIHVELTRDLKHSRKRRKGYSEIRDANTRQREGAAAQILEEFPESYVTARNILKVRLAEECKWTCPYTSESISMEALVGDEPQFEIEHIIPFSCSFDNSYMNKTLCYHEANRSKGNQTPYQAFGQSPNWPEIIERVRRFNGPFNVRNRKLQLFQAEVLPDADEFTNKQLSDTRYLSKLARDYLGLLYGGVIDEGGTIRVRATPGRCTAYLRNVWNLNSILSGHPNDKNRADHRHHAVDAIVIALTGQQTVHKLSVAAARAEELGVRNLFVDVDEPWEGFLDDARRVVKRIQVSSRVNRKLNGPLHKDTILSKPQPAIDGSDKQVHHVRKPLAAMSTHEVDAIVDPVVQRLVKEKLNAIGKTPDKAFADASNHPHFVSKKDSHRIILIHNARIRKSDKPIAIGKGMKTRYVNPGSNHHMEIVAILAPDGSEKKWKGVLVSRYDAMQRKKDGKQIVNRDHGEGHSFKFSLAGGEHVMMNTAGEGEKLYRVTVISSGRIEFVLHTDARPITLRKKERGARVHCSPNTLRTNNARKVLVDPLGRILAAND
jgi:CRISPR-associated endonuclease Csn1